MTNSVKQLDETNTQLRKETKITKNIVNNNSGDFSFEKEFFRYFNPDSIDLDKESINDQISINTEKILNSRYSKKDEDGKPIETWYDISKRIALAISANESDDKKEQYYKQFHSILANRYYICNTPGICNAGKNNMALMACYVTEIEDSIKSIMDNAKTVSLIFQAGGGVGSTYENIRPAGSTVNSTHGVASGPISFMRIIDTLTDVIKQGGCFIGDTLIATEFGLKKIKDIIPGTKVYCWDGQMKLKPSSGSWKSKINAEVWKLTTDKGLIVYATPDHPFLARYTKSKKKEYIKLKDLKIGTPLMPLTRYIKAGETMLSLQDGKDTRIPEHVWIAKELGLWYEGCHVHHKDDNHYNNISTNLEVLSPSDHIKIHNKELLKSGNHPFQNLTQEQKDKGVEGYKEWFKNLSPELKREYKDKVSKGLSKSNLKRMENGSHNFATNHPSLDPEKVNKAQKSRVANTIWKVQSKGYNINKEQWLNQVKDSGLYQNEHFRVDYIESLFGSFDSALSYANERNHKVVSVEFSHYEDVYNLEVPEVNNYVVCSDDGKGIVVSNTRRGANMAQLCISHPDILRFIHCKNDQTSFLNFNITTTVSDDFMQALELGLWYQLRFENKDWTKPIYDPLIDGDYKVYYDQENNLISFGNRKDYEERKHLIAYEVNPPKPGMILAKDIWNRICLSALSHAEPGICYIDTVNKYNCLMNTRGLLKASNPCQEQLLNSGNSCNLGSIDVSKLYEKDLTNKFNFDKFKELIWLGVRFLDNVVDVSHQPTEEIKKIVQETRPIGLGIMGWADLLVKMGIVYGSKQSLELTDNIMSFFELECVKASLALGKEKGVFYDLEANKDLYLNYLSKLGIVNNRDEITLRNYEMNTIAPTGSISLIAECSSGIEPNFSWAYNRKDSIGERGYIHPLAAEYLGIKYNHKDEKDIARASQELLDRIDELPSYFVNAHELTSEKHVRVLAKFQEYIQNAISKTCNGQNTDTVEDVDKLYRLAYELGVKAVSYYRDGSRDGQVLTATKKESKKEEVSESKESKADETEVKSLSNISQENSNEKENQSSKKQLLDQASKEFNSEMKNLKEQIKEAQIPMVEVKKVDRPKVLDGKTWKIPVDESNLYVTINHDKNQILEIFINGGVISETVGLLVSLMLRRSFTSKEIVKTLTKVKGTNTIWFNETYCSSPEQAIAECIKLMDEELKQLKTINYSVKELQDSLEDLKDIVNKNSLGNQSLPNSINEVVDLPDGSIVFNGEIWNPAPSSTKSKLQEEMQQSYNESNIPAKVTIEAQNKVNGRVRKTKTCPECSDLLISTTKCDTCQNCGWSKCK